MLLFLIGLEMDWKRITFYVLFVLSHMYRFLIKSRLKVNIAFSDSFLPWFGLANEGYEYTIYIW